MKQSKILSLLWALALMGVEAFAEQSVEVSIRPTIQNNMMTALEVQISFVGESDGETSLRLPNEWGGQNQLYLGVRDLTAENAEVLQDSEPSIQRLKHEPNAKIRLKYRVVEDEQGPKFNGRGNDYRVQMKSGYLFALGEAYVIQPENISTQQSVKVDIQFPKDIAWVSDLEHQSSKSDFVFGDLIESVLLAGDVRVIDAGGGARLAIHGKLDSRGDDQWRESFQRISKAQRSYWGASDEPFLVTILTYPPQAPGSISLGGTGRSDAFAFFATNNAEPNKLDQVMAHEMMHTWVPRRIGGIREVPAEQQDYWLSEGFTDWTSWRVLVRSGFWTPEDYLRALNENLKDYDLSPVREEPNKRIIADFWNDRSVGDLPYRRGLLLAIYWDAKVLKATQGKRDFDDVLLHMQKLASSTKDQTAVPLLIRSMQEVAGLDITSDLELYVEQGKAIEFGSDIFSPYAEWVWVEQPGFHRGFDIEKTQKAGNVVAGVIPNGPAWQAGLRDGMKLEGRKGGEIGNAKVQITYEVKDGDDTKLLSWMPTGNKTERYRTLKLAEGQNADSRSKLIGRLGGAIPKESQ